MRTSEEYKEGLRKMRRNIYVNGEKIPRDHDMQMPAINVMCHTFDFAQDPEHADLMTATSHLTGEKINRFTHIHQNPEDLHKKQDMTRFLCQNLGGCIQRCMGIDAVNALYNVTYEVDKDNGGESHYHENLKKWLLRFQQEDLVGCCAQTDVKGDRMKRPGDQEDPDQYVHVIDKNKDGII
ncbi:MAG: aromatic ring hydroxylase, partial [bacterium]|nr:aromatic ring hydroxylase [bacterium]